MTDPHKPDVIATSVEEDVAGVQGGEDTGAATPAATTPPANTPDAPAPDAGEIEWAGGLIRKPPAPPA